MSSPGADEICLEWHGGYPLSRFIVDKSLRDRFSSAGVYLWIQRYKGRKTVTYVGRALGRPSLWLRQCQHYVHMIGGSYRISADDRRTGSAWELNLDCPDAVETLSCLTRYRALVEDAFAAAQHCDVYLAPLNERASEVERALLYELSPPTTVGGTRTAPAPTLKILHKNAAWGINEVVQQCRTFPTLI